MKRKTGRDIFVRTLIFALILFLSLAYTVAAQALLQIGSPAPDFSLQDVEGRESGLSRYSGKKAVVLVFWSTWSANSKRALKRVDEFYRKFGERGIEIIGINADKQTIAPEDRENIRKAVKEWDLSFPVLLDRELGTFHGYGIVALPSTVVISEGKIAYELPGLPLVGTEKLFDYLLTLAGEQPRQKSEPAYKPRHDAIADTNLARGFVKKKLYAMAHPLFKKAIEKDPKYMLPYVEQARLYALEGKTSEAEEALRKAVSVEPENVVVMSELGYLLARAGRVKESIEVLDRAAKLNSYTPSHYYLGYSLGKAGQMKEAFEAFEKALSLNPFEETAYILRGEIYEDAKMLKDASADYRRALALMLKIED